MEGWVVYLSTRRFLGDGTFDLDSHTFRVALFVSDSNADDPELTSYYELSGEVLGTNQLASLTWTEASPTVMRLDAANMEWFGPLSDLMFAVVYDATTGALLAYYRMFDTPRTIPSGELLGIKSTSGIFDLTVV
jgi:hypothetical protein